LPQTNEITTVAKSKIFSHLKKTLFYRVRAIVQMGFIKWSTVDAAATAIGGMQCNAHVTTEKMLDDVFVANSFASFKNNTGVV
jgi:hypothetical protein